MSGPVIKGVLTGLTPAEKFYLLTHPHHIATIKANADLALATAQRLFPTEVWNGRGDAFRHCYWSALLARDIGAENAREFTTAHEAYSDNPANERAMDLANNAVGIRIGSSNANATDNDLEAAVLAAMGRGELVTAPPAAGQAYGY